MDDYFSPFPFVGPLRPDEVVGREALVAVLTARLLARRPTALLGPRRYGKTSVLRKVATDLAGVGPQTIWIDLYELTSMADLAGRIDDGLAAVSGGLRRAFRALFDGLTLNLGSVSVSFSRGSLNRAEAVLVVRQLLDGIVRTAAHHDLLLVLDEFSGIDAVKGGAGALRTALQHHYRDIALVFAGSHPSTMRMLFADRAQPFFAQADLVEIGPLDNATVEALIDEGFERTGRDAGRVADLIRDFAAGHPQRVMQLADAVWRATPAGDTASDSVWEEAIAGVRAAEETGFERLFAALPTGHQRVLRSLAVDGRVYGAAAAVLGLAPGTAKAAVDALIGDGSVVRRDDGPVIVDPLFADWIRRRFPIPT